MASDQAKDNIIHDIYYDKSGYGSINTTYLNAREGGKASNIFINKKYVEGWYSQNVGKRSQPTGQHSFVAPYPSFEFQIDSFFIKDKDFWEQKFDTGMVCVDIFSRYAVVVALEGKSGEDCASGIMESIEKMRLTGIKKPEIIYTDDDTGFSSDALKLWYLQQNIKHYITRNHAQFAERFIRTFKALLYVRLESDMKKGKVNPQWHTYIWDMMLVYTIRLIHTTTKMTPENAKKQTNQVDVKAAMKLKATRNRKYPPLDVGDTVKIQKKREPGEKDRVSRWSVQTFKVNNITEAFGRNTTR
jgi:hypothetical protein